MLGKYKIALATIGSFAFGAVAHKALTPTLGLLPMWLPKLTSKTARNLKPNFSLLLSKPWRRPVAVTLFETEGQCLFKDCHRNPGSL